MSENPYEPPSLAADQREVKRYAWRDLRGIALCQKIVLLGVLVWIVDFFLLLLMSSAAVLAESGSPALETAMAVVGLAMMVVLLLTPPVVWLFMLLLAIKVDGPLLGLLWGAGALIPCVQLLVLALLNYRVTVLLARHDVRVGLFGARLSQIGPPVG